MKPSFHHVRHVQLSRSFQACFETTLKGATLKGETNLHQFRAKQKTKPGTLRLTVRISYLSLVD